jgi:hypothetical protein
MTGGLLERGFIETLNSCTSWVNRTTVLGDTVGSVSDGTLRKGTDMVPEFAEAMSKKWSKGVSEYGREMKLDPFEEAMMECVDTANYMMAIYFRIKTLKDRVSDLDITRLGKDFGVEPEVATGIIRTFLGHFNKEVEGDN